MSLARSLCVGLVTLLVTTACSEESSTSIAGPDADWPAALTLMFPEVAAEDFMRGEVEAPADPARVLSIGDPDGPDEDAVAQVFGASTKVGFTADYAYSSGRHKYTGNKGRVETTARVSYDGTQIGTQTAFREEYVPFLLDWGETKEIWAEAYVFLDQDCGLRVDADSKHYAGWQWFLGGPAPNWGPASVSTQAFPPVSQPACAEADDSSDDGLVGGSESGGAEDSGPVTCWYWVTYDPFTGEVYEADFLFCDGLTEGG
jgi:hypothetical protein